MIFYFAVDAPSIAVFDQTLFFFAAFLSSPSCHATPSAAAFRLFLCIMHIFAADVARRRRYVDYRHAVRSTSIHRPPRPPIALPFIATLSGYCCARVIRFAHAMTRDGHSSRLIPVMHGAIRDDVATLRHTMTPARLSRKQHATALVMRKQNDIRKSYGYALMPRYRCCRTRDVVMRAAPYGAARGYHHRHYAATATIAHAAATLFRDIYACAFCAQIIERMRNARRHISSA